MKFGDDWDGVFIRGDNALMYYAPALEAVLERANWDDYPHPFIKSTLQGLLKLLYSSSEGSSKDRQILKDFEECIK